jgi:hypothetical protein
MLAFRCTNNSEVTRTIKQLPAACPVATQHAQNFYFHVIVTLKVVVGRDYTCVIYCGKEHQTETVPYIVRYNNERQLDRKYVSSCINQHRLSFGATAPQWARASSFTTFPDHTQRRIAIGKTPLDEWSARHGDLYLTTHNIHNRQTSMPPSVRRPSPSTARPLGPSLSNTANTILRYGWICLSINQVSDSLWLILFIPAACVCLKTVP